MAFNGADFGTEIELKSDDQIVAEGIAVLRKMFDEDAPEPESVQLPVGSWTLCVCSYIPRRGGPCKTPEVLARPVADRLFFAGEATNSDYPATVMGLFIRNQRS